MAATDPERNDETPSDKGFAFWTRRRAERTRPTEPPPPAARGHADDRPDESAFGEMLDDLFRRGGEGEEIAGLGEAAAAAVPDVYTFTGFLSRDDVRPPWRPRGENEDSVWRKLYLDMRRQSWLLIEKRGILTNSTVRDRKVPGGERDVVWVTADTGIGIGRGSPSNEAEFLTGDFTRAADFRASPNGGTMAASTGVFCEAESIGCCRPTKKS